VGPRAGRVFLWKRRKSLAPARVMVISDISKLRQSVQKLLDGCNADMIRSLFGLCSAGKLGQIFLSLSSDR